MKITAVVEGLVASGASPEMILAAVRAIEVQQTDALEKRREADRNRQNKKRNAEAVTLCHVTSERSRSHVRVEDSSSKKDISGKEEKKESAAKPRGLDDFKAELSSILNAERIDALVAVRRKKGAVLSAHAGKLLSQALLACPNVNVAADEMVLRNWTGIKPDWLEKRTTGPPSGKRMNAVEANLARRIRKDESASGRRDYGDAELLPPDRPGLPDFAGDVGKALTWDG